MAPWGAKSAPYVALGPHGAPWGLVGKDAVEALFGPLNKIDVAIWAQMALRALNGCCKVPIEATYPCV